MSDIIVSAFATNLLGDGPGSDPITIVSGMHHSYIDIVLCTVCVCRGGGGGGFA